jgi:hypothetical protein
LLEDLPNQTIRNTAETICDRAVKKNSLHQHHCDASRCLGASALTRRK